MFYVDHLRAPSALLQLPNVVQLLQKWSGLMTSWLQTVMRPACSKLCVSPNLAAMLCQSGFVFS